MKCFYHNDLDGRCAGSIVAQYEHNYNKEDYFEVDYTIDLMPMINQITKNETVYFVDYSFKQNTEYILDILVSNDCNIIWCDHHTSSINLENTKGFEWIKNIKGIRKDGISGAALTYMYLYDCKFEQIPYYIKLVSDYDCWQYKYEPDTTYFKLGVETELYDALDKVWTELADYDALYRLSGGGYEKVPMLQTKTGKTIKKYIDQDNNYYRNHFAYESIIAGNKALVVNKKSNSWIFGDKYNQYPIVCVWVFNGSKYSYSIFSNNSEIDCSKIAESYGGGGHKGAAGFSSDELLFKASK